MWISWNLPDGGRDAFQLESLAFPTLKLYTSRVLGWPALLALYSLQKLLFFISHAGHSFATHGRKFPLEIPLFVCVGVSNVQAKRYLLHAREQGEQRSGLCTKGGELREAALLSQQLQILPSSKTPWGWGRMMFPCAPACLGSELSMSSLLTTGLGS